MNHKHLGFIYEQERRAVSAVSPLEVYVRRRLKWARAGYWVEGEGREVIVWE
jgi:hypothetical protein